MADLAAVEQAKAEATARRMAEMIAEDVHQVMMKDVNYAEVLKRLAVATIVALETEMQVSGLPGGSTRG